MAIKITTEPVPLAMDNDGVIRVAGTRITLDTVIAAFNEGATADEIVADYSSLDLADVYAVISYYLHNSAAVDTYLIERQQQAKKIRQQNEARFDPHGIRNRLLARCPDKKVVDSASAAGSSSLHHG